MKNSVSQNILLVCRSFYPVITPRSLRVTELAKEFSRQGHKVTILTQTNGYDYSDFEILHNLEVLNIDSKGWFEIKGRNIFKRILRFSLKYFFLFPEIQLSFYVAKEVEKFKNIDLLISFANPYPIHWGIAIAKARNENICKTWVADCGDPFTGNKEIKLRYPFYFKYIERWFTKKANFISIPIKEAINSYPKSCKEKIKIIPQGFNFEETMAAMESYSGNEILTFGYAGTLNEHIRNPKLLLDFLVLKNDLNFRFIIYTNNSNLIKSYKTILNNKLVIRDYVPRLDLLKEMSKMDFLINFENRGSVQSPSKLIDYSLTKRPILTLKAFELNYGVIEEFLKRDYSNKMIIDDVFKYDIKYIIKQFLMLIKE